MSQCCALYAANGSGMSAPHVTGVVALMLEKQPRLTATQVRKIVIAAVRPPTGINSFDNGWGFGKLDATEAIDLVE